MKKRIICVGNPYRPEDDAGPRVHELLARERLPDGIQLIDGGLAGLNLLRWMDDVEEVVFVDSVTGFAGPGGVVVLSPEEASAHTDPAYGHAAGLGYLLRVLPRVHEGKTPGMTVVGIESPADDTTVARAARISVSILAPETEERAGGSGCASGTAS